MAISTYLSIITLNDDGLNAPIKRHSVADWINNTHLYATYKRLTFRAKDTCKLKVRGWKKIFYANGNLKKADIAILIADKYHLKQSIIKDKKALNNDK